jgi:hypothetical protein
MLRYLNDLKLEPLNASRDIILQKLLQLFNFLTASEKLRMRTFKKATILKKKHLTASEIVLVSKFFGWVLKILI